MTDFFFKVVSNFVFQLFCAEMLFFRSMKRRKYFILRSALAIAGLVLASLFISSGQLRIGWFDFYFLIQFTIIILFSWLCFQESLQKIVFFGVGSYAIQHLSYNFTVIMSRIFQVSIFRTSFSGILLFILCFAACYTACYFLFARRIKPSETLGPFGSHLMIVSAGIIMIVYVLSMYMVSERLIFNYGVITYAMCCCAGALFIQFGLLERGKLTMEKDTVSHMLKEAERQQRDAKDNIDFINIKCHDLKKQITALRVIDDKKTRDKSIREIENAVMLFDSIAKTGNESLDIILTEKSIQCEKRGIQFTYIADGAQLNFMNPIDIYSMFENAIENAIESMTNVEIPEKRILSLNISSKGKLLSIHMENYIEKQPVFENGFPVTTKEDKLYHGFGLKSIKFIAEKYEGNMEILVHDDRFVLDILIPIRETSDAD